MVVTRGANTVQLILLAIGLWGRCDVTGARLVGLTDRGMLWGWSGLCRINHNIDDGCAVM